MRRERVAQQPQVFSFTAQIAGVAKQPQVFSFTAQIAGAAKQPQVFSFAAQIAGAASRPFRDARPLLQTDIRGHKHNSHPHRTAFDPYLLAMPSELLSSAVFLCIGAFHVHSRNPHCHP